jgi:hypothetical protein
VSWRPLWLFVFSLASVVVAIVLFIALFSWSMADFDCADGYLACRQLWFRNEGIWAGMIIISWSVGAAWLYRTREKK